MQAAEERYADFDEVARNPTLPISTDMAQVIQTLENGPDVLYALGRNPQEAARIASLPRELAAFALGSFAAAQAAPPKQPVRPAPQPINPLAGGNAAPTVDPDKLSTDEWVKWRRSQLRQ